MHRLIIAIMKRTRTAAFFCAAVALCANAAAAQATSADAKGSAQRPNVWVETRPIPLAAAGNSAAPRAEPPARPPAPAGRVGVEEQNSFPLTLDEAVRLALENNRDLDDSRVDVEVAEHELTAARGAYDLRFSSETYFERSTTPVASFLGGSRDGSLRATELTGTAAFEGLSPWAGGSFRFEFNSTRRSTNNFFNDLNPTHATGFRFSYTQPLLRGRRTDDTRRRIRVARKQLSLTDAQFRRRATEVITGVEQAYWELAYALKHLQIQHEALKQARAQTASNRRQVEHGVLAPIEVTEAEAQVRVFEQHVAGAQESVTRAENQLKTMLLAERGHELWSRPLLPVSPVEPDVPRVALEQAVASALANRLELTELSAAADINQIDERYFRDQTRPQADLTASYSSNGLAGSLNETGDNPLLSGLVSLHDRVNQLSTLAGLPALPGGNFPAPRDELLGGYGRSLANLFAQHNPTFKVGVRISFPLRNRTARANLARAQAEGRRVENRRARAEQLIEAEVRNALQALRSGEARLAAASAEREAAEQQYTSERRKFGAGASTVYLVLQRQTDLVTARGRELQAQTDLNKSIADFRRVTGDTLRSHRVSVTAGASLGPSRPTDKDNAAPSAYSFVKE
jgi:HAE1 family hydrophobic/amphiphilic exporter-1